MSWVTLLKCSRLRSFTVDGVDHFLSRQSILKAWSKSQLVTTLIAMRIGYIWLHRYCNNTWGGRVHIGFSDQVWRNQPRGQPQGVPKVLRLSQRLILVYEDRKTAISSSTGLVLHRSTQGTHCNKRVANWCLCHHSCGSWESVLNWDLTSISKHTCYSIEEEWA